MKIVNDDGTPVSIGAAIGHWLQAVVTWCVSFFLRTILYVGACASIAVLVLVLVGHSSPAPFPWPFPTPAPPAPTDPLTKTFQAAYASDTDAGKADKLAALTDYYGAVVGVERTANTATLKDLETHIHTRADLITGAGGMPNLRGAVKKYVAGKMPTQDAAMTEAYWLDATTAYGDVVKALKGVK